MGDLIIGIGMGLSPNVLMTNISRQVGVPFETRGEAQNCLGLRHWYNKEQILSLSLLGVTSWSE